ncbi:MAG: DUF1345 domain-containing protein [Mycobacterium sp.]|nr:DUF1345 domain-containing protein [Mycobacterium sp.]
MSGAARFWLSSAAGLVAGAGAWALWERWPVSLLTVVITTAVTNVTWALAVQWPMDPEQTRVHASDEDVNKDVGNLVRVLVLAASLSAIGILLKSAIEADKASYAAMSLIAILATWALLHTMYTARYAGFYYSGTTGGIDFNSDVPPRYVDFYYFSFNLGMTYQVSDTAVTESDIRAEVLAHCLFSYIYGTVIIACTINLVINLVG